MNPKLELDIFSDERFMREALKEAQYAFEEDEVPIGSVIVLNNRIIGRGHNQVEKLCDPTAHAEMIAITAACEHLGAKYLEQCTIFVTIEPCPMCAAALRWARPERIVFGAREPKHGFLRLGIEMIHPATQLAEGVMKNECAELMTTFFKGKR